jgi:simple sugar transport system ATP-binding protein
VSLQVRSGEIVGIAGVAGNGQSELAQVITGLRPCRGRIVVAGADTANHSPGDVIRRGVAHVPEDRTGVGSAPNLSLTDNLIMKRYRQPPIAHGWVMDTTQARRVAEHLKDDYQILAPSTQVAVRLLSGGNLQRLILAREMDVEPRLLVAVQPTRGLDVGAIEGVHRLLLARREAGAATVLISEELDEIFALSDRIAVMYEGRLRGPFDVAAVDMTGIGLLMTGGEWSPGDSTSADSKSGGSAPGAPTPAGGGDAVPGATAGMG